MWNRWLFLTCNIAARWKHDTKMGPQVVRRNADDLQSVAADNGFQDWHTEYEIAAHDIDYLSHYRGSSANAAAKTLSTGQKVTQRWMAETSYSINEALARRRRASAGLVSTVP